MRDRPEKIRCDACPVMCYIAEGHAGACDRYANQGGRIVRVDPLTILEQTVGQGGDVVRFLEGPWDGNPVTRPERFVTGIGSGTTYPDYKPAPFIVSRQVAGADLVTVVTEGIFSYCGVKVKIDTDRHIGPEQATVRVDGEPVGHVTTAEYGSQMLSLGGVRHLTGGEKAEGRVTCATLLSLCNREPVEMAVDGGSTLNVQAGRPPVIDGHREERMRVGCGSASIGMFATQWHGLVDEVVVVDDHITGVVSEHQAGKVLGWPDTGIRIKGRRSTPGRYFPCCRPRQRLGWHGYRGPADDPRPLEREEGRAAGTDALDGLDHRRAMGLLRARRRSGALPAPLPEALRRSVELIDQNCEPALCSVLFMGGAGARCEPASRRTRSADPLGPPAGYARHLSAVRRSMSGRAAASR